MKQMMTGCQSVCTAGVDAKQDLARWTRTGVDRFHADRACLFGGGVLRVGRGEQGMVIVQFGRSELRLISIVL